MSMGNLFSLPIHVAETLKLAGELKSLCYANGKERLPKQTAKVIHKLGQAYRQIADVSKDGREQKVSLIRSAVLLNAAIVRKPDNVAEVQKDLDDLCSHVLQLAGSSANVEELKKLVTKSKERTESMRDWVKVILTSFSSMTCCDVRARRMEQLQALISEDYSAIMAKIMEFCVEAKSPIPCQYALVGMGSLARKEITPYSDFEHIYVLEEGIQWRSDYEDILEYFRWMVVLFQLAVVNMGETIIPHISLPCLNDWDGKNWFYDAFTPNGISFDGMVPFACKFPLGRSATRDKPWNTELIKPVSEMLKYLNSDEDLKNGYHLADVLTKSCFVFGCISVYDDFNCGVVAILTSPTSRNKLFKVNEDLDEHYTTIIMDRSSVPRLNFKKLVYRGTTLFLTALERFHQYNSQYTSFETVRRLQKQNLISAQESFDFQFALAFACEVRLKLYSEVDRQLDWVDEREENKDLGEKLLSLFLPLDIITYFLSTYALQKYVGDTFGIEREINLTVVDITKVCFFLKLTKDAERLCDNWIARNWNANSHRGHLCTFTLLKSLCCAHRQDYERMVEQCAAYVDLTGTTVDAITNSLVVGYYNLHEFTKAIEFSSRVGGEDHPYAVKITLARCYANIGDSRSVQALLNDVLCSEEFSKQPQLVDFSSIAECYTFLNDYENSIRFRKLALHKSKKQAASEINDADVGLMYFELGDCYRSFTKHEEAVTALENALEVLYEIKKNSTSHQNSLHIALCWNAVSKLQLANGDPYSAMECSVKACSLLEGNPEDKGGAFLAESLLQNAHCEVNNCAMTLKHANRAREIFEDCGVERHASNAVQSYHFCALSLRDLGRDDESLSNFKVARAILLRARVENGNAKLAVSNSQIAKLLLKKGKYSEAIEYCEEVQALVEADHPLHSQTDYQLAFCLCMLKEYEEGLKYAQKRMKYLIRSVEQDPRENAWCYSLLGSFLIELNRSDEAEPYLAEAVKNGEASNIASWITEKWSETLGEVRTKMSAIQEERS